MVSLSLNLNTWSIPRSMEVIQRGFLQDTTLRMVSGMVNFSFRLFFRHQLH